MIVISFTGHVEKVEKTNTSSFLKQVDVVSARGGYPNVVSTWVILQEISDPHFLRSGHLSPQESAGKSQVSVFLTPQTNPSGALVF